MDRYNKEIKKQMDEQFAQRQYILNRIKVINEKRSYYDSVEANYVRQLNVINAKLLDLTER